MVHFQSQTSSGRASATKNKPHPFLRQGEGLARYGRGQRSQRKKPVKQSVEKSSRLVAPPPPSGPAHQGDGRSSRPLLGSQFASDESFIVRGSQRVQVSITTGVQ